MNKEDKHAIFYRAWSYLRTDAGLVSGMKINTSSADDLDQLIWSTLGHLNTFELNCIQHLSSSDIDRLKMLCPPHGVTIFKMMLVR